MQKDQLHFLDLVNEAHWDAIELVELLAKRFPSAFRDVYTFEEKELHFYKRAQLVPHLLSNLHKQGFISKDISNIKDLSALADYKVPQMLRQLGILSYNEHLAKTIHEKKELPEQSRKEIEIRVATIEAIDQIVAELQRLGCSSSAAEVDHFLWTQSQNNDATIEPYHRTRTIWY